MAAAVPEQPSDQDEDQSREAAMQAAASTAKKQLKEAQKKVQDLVKNGSTAQHITNASTFLDNAVEQLKEFKNIDRVWFERHVTTVRKIVDVMPEDCKRTGAGPFTVLGRSE